MNFYPDLLRPVLLALILGFFAAPPPVSATTTHYVNVRNIAFDPYELTVATGDTVVWVFQEGPHTVTGAGGTNDAFCGDGDLFKGNTCSQVFNTAGSYFYRCLNHSDAFPRMNGAVFVTNNNPPSVTLTQPANAAEFVVFSPFTLEATASDSDGTVRMVEFLYGPNSLSATNFTSLTNLIGSVTTSTLLTNSLFQLDTTNMPPGRYTIAARATDNAGGTKFSDGITVTIRPQITGPEIITLTNGEPAFQFFVSRTPGSNYIVQATTNLKSTNNWVSLQTNQATTNRFLWQDLSFTNSAFRFYRVLQTP